MKCNHFVLLAFRDRYLPCYLLTIPFYRIDMFDIFFGGIGGMRAVDYGGAVRNLLLPPHPAENDKAAFTAAEASVPSTREIYQYIIRMFIIREKGPTYVTK